MANQLLLYVSGSDQFRWCWLGADQKPLLDSAGSGSLEDLGRLLGEGEHEVWLLLPGAKVITRELESSEAEKKHLRRLLPFQMEESVIGDIDQFHFALGPMREGQVAVAYVERPWLSEIFAQLKSLGITVSHCSSLPLLLPLPPAAPATEPADSDHYPYWTLQLQNDHLLVRAAPSLGYSLPRERARMGLEMLLTAQQRVDNLPHLILRANTDSDLVALEALLPDDLAGRIDSQTLVELWQLDLSAPVIDLCQGEFSQRLPVGRWWGVWRGMVTATAACLVVYVGVLFYQVQMLEAENLEVRREIERVYRNVAGQGVMVDAEHELRQQIAEVQPAGVGRRLSPFLAEVLPVFEEIQDATLRAISYSAGNAELSLNVQAGAFSTIETLRERINQSGLSAELHSASAQGELHSARHKVSQQPL